MMAEWNIETWRALRPEYGVRGKVRPQAQTLKASSTREDTYKAKFAWIGGMV